MIGGSASNGHFDAVADDYELTIQLTRPSFQAGTQIHHVTEQLTLRASWELRLESESFTGQHGSRKTGLLAP